MKCLLIPLAAVLPAAAVHASPDPAKLEFFEKRIRPILSENCYSCHAADTKAAGGLRVDDLNGLLQGGDGGAAVVRGNAGESSLIRRIRHAEERRRMPKDSDALSEAEIADLEKWIDDGAVWPEEEIPSYIGKDRTKYENLRKSHWSWQPLATPPVPVVKDAAWPAGEVDHFILAKLEGKGLAPVGDADRATLLRRVSYDLTGLPPSPEELRAFMGDAGPDAYEKVVDRLLSSDAFGERWGRHWLDVARYGESTGPSRNIPYPHAWKYRDYVIDSVSRDVPFDLFLREQIAGDLLPGEDGKERDRLLTATGFLALGVKDVNQRFKIRFQMDNVDEQIDTVTRSVLGLTVSCARCHDHKTDPVPTTEYYSLAGIFTSTEDGAGVRNKMGGGGLDYYDAEKLVRLTSDDLPPPDPVKAAELRKKADEAKKEWDEIRGTPEGLKRNANGQPVQRAYRLRYEKAQAELMDLTDPAARGLAVHGVREAEQIADTQVRIRGEAERLGPEVPRGFPGIFAVPGAPEIDPAQSGRLQLAEWLTHPGNPLTPRVAVNRIWKHLFGEGLVITVDNFGVTGDAPSHPELLDHLANRFVAGGWSVKKTIRELVLSRTYRLGGDAPARLLEVDPANRLLWRHAPRRMSAEEIRDTILAVSGKLDRQPPSGAPVDKLKMIEMRDNGQEAATVHRNANTSLHRSVYLPLLRGVTPRALEAFDPVGQTLVSGRREETTVPSQALFMLNSSFVRGQALALAGGLAAGDVPGEERVRSVFLSAYGREPHESELSAALALLEEFENAPHETLVARAEISESSDADRPIVADAQAANPDDIPRDDQTATEEVVEAGDARTAAWMTLVQSVFASAEFRFVR
ncbi:MAG: PSD1 domain-containing protein [Akkermansiaceae bacterium]|nr:PSD1 domain-containing protein [Akkermansiaceae bacterium]